MAKKVHTNADEISKILESVRTFGKKHTKNQKLSSVQKFIQYITEAKDWTDEQGFRFYEFVLRRYIDDDKTLDMMLAVSGISRGYGIFPCATERRKKYNDHLCELDPDAFASNDTLVAREDAILSQVAKKLQAEIEEGKLPKLIELWKAEMEEDPEPSLETQDSSMKLETENSNVQPEIHISNDANVSPAINNTIANDNNITIQVSNNIHLETASSLMSMDISTSNEESQPLINRKRNMAILLISFLVIMLFCWLLLSKSILPLADNSFVSDEEVSLKPGEIYEIKTAAFPKDTQSPILDFISSDPSIAKVSEKGIVVAQDKTGTCKIVVQDKSGRTAQITILVSGPKEAVLVPEIGDGSENVSGISLNTKVHNIRKASNEWEDTVDAAVGDIVEFLVECSVSNSKNLDDIVIRDVLPQYMEYIPGTIRLYNTEHESGIYLEQDTITTEGIRIAPYLTDGKISLRFAAKIFNVDSNSTPVLLANEAQVWNETKKETLLKDYSYIEASFWGPERSTYTMYQSVDHATFNSIIDNPTIGDERDFVRIAEKREDGSAVYSNDIILEADKQYEVCIFFHNNASAVYNDSTHDNIGISWNTRLSCDFPNKLEAGQRAAVVGRITSTSAEPEMIWDAANITASQNITLHFMPATAKIYSNQKWQTNGVGLSTNLFSTKGTFIGLLSLNGTIPGCDEYSGYVVYTIQTYAVRDMK